MLPAPLRSLAGALLVFQLAACSGASADLRAGSAAKADAQPAPRGLTAASLNDLREAFNAAAGHPRLIAFLSPT